MREDNDSDSESIRHSFACKALAVGTWQLLKKLYMEF